MFEFLKGMFAKTSVEDMLATKGSDKELKRTLGPIALVLLGIGAIIGAGIFIVSGVAAAITGPSVIISFILAGIICTLIAFCYAEMASVITVTGGIYAFTKVTMGKFYAWIAGWINIMQYTVVSAAIAIGWSGYLDAFLKDLGIILPHTFINIPAVLIVLVITGLLCLGASESTKINGIIVAIKLAVIGLFIAIGATHINAVNWTPFMPEGLTGILAATSMVFFAYTGFDAVASAAEEAKNPQRNLPIGIIGSLAICTLLYILVTIVMTGMVKYTVFIGSNSPIELALSTVGAGIITPILTFGAIAGLTTVILVAMYIVPRSIFAMSRDGLMPEGLSKLNNKGTPSRSVILVGIIAAILAGFVTLGEVVSLVNIAALTVFCMIAVAVILLRRQRPDLKRGFTMPLVPWLPIIAIVGCVGLLTQMALWLLALFFGWILVGVLVFVFYQWFKARR